MQLMGFNEAVFILPVFIFALATHALSIVIGRRLGGDVFALITSLLFFCSPFETLASTSNVPDYFHAFFILLAAYFLMRSYESNSFWFSAIAGFFTGIAFTNRMSAILALPVFALAHIFSFRRKRFVVGFWFTLAICFGLFCLGDRLYSGEYFRWIVKNSGGGGVDVTHILKYVLLVYPRYIFHTDNFGNWMFASIGWLCAIGAIIALLRVLRGRKGVPEVFVLLSFFVYLGLFEFLPHRLSIDAFYSHSRIFRYIAQVSPFIYLGAAYSIAMLLRVNSRIVQGLAVATLAGTFCFGLLETPSVTYPSRNANRDGRALVRYLQENPPNEQTIISTDYWRIAWLSGLNHPQARKWIFKGVTSDSKEAKVEFLQSRTEGLVVTGGASLPWYSGIDLIISLSRLQFTPPPHWRLMYHFPGEINEWRAEPLQVWRVEKLSQQLPTTTGASTSGATKTMIPSSDSLTDK